MQESAIEGHRCRRAPKKGIVHKMTTDPTSELLFHTRGGPHRRFTVPEEVHRELPRLPRAQQQGPLERLPGLQLRPVTPHFVQLGLRWVRGGCRRQAGQQYVLVGIFEYPVCERGTRVRDS
jgi:hypothetical protein